MKSKIFYLKAWRILINKTKKNLENLRSSTQDKICDRILTKLTSHIQIGKTLRSHKIVDWASSRRSENLSLDFIDFLIVAKALNFPAVSERNSAMLLVRFLNVLSLEKISEVFEASQSCHEIFMFPSAMTEQDVTSLHTIPWAFSGQPFWKLFAIYKLANSHL